MVLCIVSESETHNGSFILGSVKRFCVLVAYSSMPVWWPRGCWFNFWPSALGRLFTHMCFCPCLALPCLAFGVGRLLHLPSAEAVSVWPNAHPHVFGQLLVRSCPPDCRNLSGHWSKAPPPRQGGWPRWGCASVIKQYNFLPFIGGDALWLRRQSQYWRKVIAD